MCIAARTEPFTLAAGGSVRKSFPNLDRGQNIVVTERVLYKTDGVDVSPPK